MVDTRNQARGESYKVDLYEGAIGRAFEHVAVSARLKVDTVAAATRPDPEGGDVLATARITRERDRAALRFARDRDLGRLEATMARLDTEAAAAVVRPSRTPTAAETRAYLEELSKLWAKTSDAGRHAIAEAVFERIDVLGVTDYTFTLTAHAKARGWDAAFGAGDVAVTNGQSGRGERSRTCAYPLGFPADPDRRSRRLAENVHRERLIQSAPESGPASHRVSVEDSDLCPIPG